MSASDGERYDQAVAAGFVDCLVTRFNKKHPIVEWTQYEHRHLTEAERAEQRELAESIVNPGFWSPMGGPHGMVAFDPDDKIAAVFLRDTVGRECVESTARERTPRGGFHVLFAAPEDDCLRNNGDAGIGGCDSLHFRGHGGGIKHWPSAGYVMQQTPADGLEPLPDNLRRLVEQSCKSDIGDDVSPEGEEPKRIPKHKRNRTLFGDGCAMRRRGLDLAAICAALLAENEAQCEPPLLDEEVRKIAASCAKYKPGDSENDWWREFTKHRAGTDPPSLLTCLADVEPKAVEWLWSRRIPRGMPSVLFGLTGLGKSHVWIDMAARISTGAPWPDGGRAPLGNVVILSAEDDVETVLVPRLDTSGADRSRVFAFPSVAIFDSDDEKRRKRTFNLTTDLERLERDLLSVQAVLGIVDPVTAYLSGVETHIVSEVRAAMALIDEVARSTGAAILCVMHPNKNAASDTKAVQRLSGSGAFGDAPRSVMLVAADPEDEEEERRLLLPAKLNIGRKPDGLGFRIHAAAPDTCNSCALWDEEPVTIDADEACGARHADSPAMTAAKDFLRAALADGEWHEGTDLIDEADTCGITERTLQRARGRLHLEGRKSGFQGTYSWRWPRGRDE